MQNAVMVNPNFHPTEITGVVPTVHAILGGKSLCGYSDEVSEFWPADHIGVQLEKAEEVTCPDCRGRIRKGP